MSEKTRNTNRGEFYTPNHVSDLLFDLTNKYIPNFNKTHVVWDPCWGTGNLTVGREFDSLYCSTIQKMDIRKNRSRNPEAVKFQYDFLNLDIEPLVSPQAMWMGETELPEDLDEILRDKKGRPIVIYMNPPYVATGIFGSHNTDTRDGQTQSMMRDIMREHKMQSACDQAYAQFLYRVNLMRSAYDNKDISIAVICPPLFLTTEYYSNFRKSFLNNFKFMGGALFKASEFEGLSDRWGITIQIYAPGVTEDKKNFKFDIYKKDVGTNKLVRAGEKLIYNLDGELTCMDWVKGDINTDNLEVARNTLSSGCKVSNKKSVSWERGSLGYLFYRGNNIYHNDQELGIMSLPYGDGAGYGVTKANFEKTMVIFCARGCFGKHGANWVNDKDEFCIPDVDSDEYRTLMANSMVYALFNSSSHMSSIFIKEEDGGIMEVPNNFHHIRLSDTIDAFKEHKMKVSGPGKLEDRFFVDKVEWAVETGRLYREGLELLTEYRRIWSRTIPYREEFNEKFPEYQVMNWDAGYYQLKWLLKHFMPEEFRRISKIYKKFENRLRLLVHKCGFLR